MAMNIAEGLDMFGRLLCYCALRSAFRSEPFQNWSYHQLCRLPSAARCKFILLVWYS